MKYLIALAVALTSLAATPQGNDGLQPFSDRDVTCLAKVVYFEARGEPPAARREVAEVVLNRVERGFAPTICAVVYQRGQFPWAARAPRVREAARYADARELAFRLLAGFEPRTDHRSTHFYSGRRPAWAREMFVTSHIGKHLFLW